MQGFPRRSLRCILFAGEQTKDPTFAFTALILVALAISGLLAVRHAAAVTVAAAAVATVVAKVAESVAAAAVRVSIRLR